MPVVINEFEAVAESASAQAPGGAAPGPAATRVDASTLRPPLRRLARRLERVRAH